MATIKLCIQILFLVSCTGTLSTVIPHKDGDSENCIMSFVIPRDKVKNSCQNEEKVNRRLNSMEVKLNMYRREVTALQTQLQKERQLCHDKVQVLETKMASLDSDSKYYDLEKKLENLEQVLKKRDTPEVVDNRQTKNRNLNYAKSKNHPSIDSSDLESVVKPIIISEIENYLENFTRIVEKKDFEPEEENNKIMNMLPRNDQSFDEVKVNGTKTREIIRELEMLENKLNTTGDELVTTVGNLLKNVTIKRVIPVQRLNTSELQPENVTNSFETNDTYIVEIDDKGKDVNRKMNKVSSRISGSDVSHNTQNDQGTEVYADIYSDELEEMLRGEINNLLQNKMEEVISLMRKQSSNLVNVVDQQGKEIDDLEEGQEERMKRLQDKMEGLTLEMSSLSSTVQEMFGKIDKIASLQMVVEEMKKNLTSASGGKNPEMVRRVDEHGKKIRTLDRLNTIFQQSLQHYRNESKAAYTEMQNKLSNLESTLAKDVTTDLYVNITSKVEHDIQRFNSTLKNKANSMEAAVRNLEDNSVLFQMDLQNLERRHKSKTGKLEADFGSLKSRVDRVNNQNRKLNDNLSNVKNNQKSLVAKFNASADMLQSLEIEFKLSITESWVEYNFDYDTTRTECFGKQYIRRTKFRNGRLAGVVLCPNMGNLRYKIMLANSVTDKFANIGDVSGFGEDHCEFVGATDSSIIRLSPPAISMKTEEGFGRESWGQEPKRVQLNFLRPSPAWYECGIRIPM